MCVVATALMTDSLATAAGAQDYRAEIMVHVVDPCVYQAANESKSGLPPEQNPSRPQAPATPDGPSALGGAIPRAGSS